MVFSSLSFIFLFMPLFFIIYLLFKNIKIKNIILLVFSLFFYAWGESIYVFLMLGCIVINYLMAIIIEKQKNSKIYLVLTVTIDILILCGFKYTDFLIDTFNFIFNTNIKNLNIPLPIGISFFMFQIISYVVDVYKKEVKAQRNLLFLGAYVSAFPQLIAGPIVRYQTIDKELTDRSISIDDFAVGIRRFIIGLFKKVVLANNVGYVCNSILRTNASDFGFIGAWLGVICYTLQIYFDFSGYSDMAIGLGRMMGFHFLENFNYPYIASSITDFWRRWHISLSTFFRDYVYIPLGGNRVHFKRWIVNISVVWLLTGLWHGASWNFVLWGVYYGLLLVIEKLYLIKYIKNWNRVWQSAYTMFFVIIGWAIFRIEDITKLIDCIKAMFFYYSIGSIDYFTYIQVFQIKYIVIFIISILAVTPVFKYITAKIEKLKYAQTLEDIILIIMFIISILFLIVSDYNPFIYFRF